MGSIFSGAIEDLLLYWAIPMALSAFVTAMFVLELVTRERFRRHERSWLAVPVPTDTAHFRTAAVLPGRAPTEVGVLVRFVLAWAVSLAIFLGSVALLATVARVWWLIPIALGLGIPTTVRMVQGALAMCDRDGANVRLQIPRARTWLLVHHGVVFVTGTGLLLLLVVSNQFFWNGASDHGSGHLVEFVALYLNLVLIPAGVGVLLAQRLGRVLHDYAETSAASVPIAADPTRT